MKNPKSSKLYKLARKYCGKTSMIYEIKDKHFPYGVLYSINVMYDESVSGGVPTCIVDIYKGGMGKPKIFVFIKEDKRKWIIAPQPLRKAHGAKKNPKSKAKSKSYIKIVSDGDIFTYNHKTFLFQGGYLYWLPHGKYESHEDLIPAYSFSSKDLKSMYDVNYGYKVNMKRALEFFDFKEARPKKKNPKSKSKPKPKSKSKPKKKKSTRPPKEFWDKVYPEVERYYKKRYPKTYKKRAETVTAHIWHHGISPSKKAIFEYLRARREQKAFDDRKCPKCSKKLKLRGIKDTNIGKRKVWECTKCNKLFANQ